MRLIRILSLAVLAVALVVTTGCTSIGLDPPDLHLADLQMEEVTVLESSGRVSLRVVNGNPEPLQVDGLALTLRLNGRKIGKVLSPERVEVPRLSTVTVEGELHVSHLAVLTLIQDIMESEAVDYSLSGKIYVLTELGRRGVRVERKGRFDFEEGDISVDEDYGEREP